MASLRDQMKIHEASKVATAALEASSRSSISRIFQTWESGDLTPSSVRYRLEGVIRSAYRASAGVARGVALESSGIEGWKTQEVFNTAYLQDLLEDVRSNLRKVKSGELTRSQAISRMEHSAGVAAQRGYTDQIISSYSELEDLGMVLRKYWVANFENNTPCPACVRLHGTSVGLNESFRAETGEPGVYRDLVGPPRHPRCQCRLFIFIKTLETSFEEPNFEKPQDAPSLMTSAEVRRMPWSILKAVLATLRAILRVVRGA